jgi:hypothetical protein
MENEKMKNVSLGSKKKVFKSVRLAAEAAGVPYMTFYMRLRSAEKAGGLGWKAYSTFHKPVRKYVRKVAEGQDNG